MSKTKRSGRLVATVATMSVGVLAMTGCAGGGTNGDEPAVLSVATSAAITTWDPVMSFSTEAAYLANVYEPLLWADAGSEGTEFSPGIAETWQASDDGMTWTFHLREDATFHDGEAVDADAVVASIEAVRERGAAAFIWAPLDTIAAVDATTVEMQLTYPAPMDIIASSTYGAWIVSPAALEASADDPQYFEAGIDAGSGPFQIESYTPGEEVVLERYDEHWNDELDVEWDVVQALITPDAVTAQQMLTAGEIDYATNVPIENAESVAEQIGGEVSAQSSPFSYLAYFNTAVEPLDDPAVRQALSYAMPYEEIIEIGGQGYGTQSHGPVPAGVFPYSEDVPMYEQDLDRARELLAEAGYADGGFTLDLTYASENAVEARVVPLIADAFAEIGVTLEIEAMQFNQQWDLGKGDPTDAQDIFLLYYWPSYADAGSDNLHAMFHSSNPADFNLAYWSNADYDALIEEAATLTATDRDQAQALYSQAMELLYEQAPGAFLFDTQSVQVIPPAIELEPYNANYPFTLFFHRVHPAE